MATFLETFSKLKQARTVAARRKLTTEAAALLAQDERHLDVTIRPLLLMTLRTLPQVEAADLVKSDYFHMRVATYVDDDDAVRVTIGITFLQDHRFFLADAEAIIAAEVKEMLELMNLDILVNDVTVNALQYRQGVLVTA